MQRFLLSRGEQNLDLKLLTLSGFLLQRNQSFLSTYLGRETIVTFLYENQSLRLYKGSPHMSLRKAFGDDFEPCNQWPSNQKATETATATLAAIQNSFPWRQSNFVTFVPWFTNIKVIKGRRWFVDYSWHKGLKKLGRHEGQFYWCLKHITPSKRQNLEGNLQDQLQKTPSIKNQKM